MKKLVFKGRNRSIFSLLFALGVLFFLIGCPALPNNWLDTSIDLSDGTLTGLTTLNIETTGYPPFIFEAYDNPFFEGTPQGRAVSEKEGVNNIVSLPGSTISLNYGTPLYLRVRSEYGQWQIFSSDDGKPTMFLPLNTGVDEGNPSRPFLLSTKQDLIDLSNEDSRYQGIFLDPWEASYILVNDIDLTGVVFTSIGYSYIADYPFTGEFNGNGHIISGFEQVTVAFGSDMGLFGNTEGALIKNLGVKVGDLNISGAAALGGVVGNAGTGTIISECYVIGTRIKGGNAFTGGLVGNQDTNVVINNCYSNITVEGEQKTGGLVGAANGTAGAVSFSYSAGDVIYYGPDVDETGGFIGYIGSLAALPVSCIALNERVLNSSGSNGELHYFGKTDNNIGIIDVYHNRDIYSPDGSNLFYGTGVAGSGYSIAVSPYTLSQNTAPFNSWDFNTIWKWDALTNRPILRKVGQ